MGMPGGTLSLTVNGTDRGSAVLWASLPHHDDAFTKDVAGILRAIDPETLTELWNNESEAYLYAKYCPPTIANGKVFLATFSGWLDVYGLKP
jgi:outer membrane protein assembly factor BamB